MDGSIITNLQYVSGSALAGEDNCKKEAKDGQKEEAYVDIDASNGNDEAVVMSPEKITRKATTLSGIPQEALHGQRDLVQGLIQQWVDKRGSKELPPDLVALGERVGIKVATIDRSTPNRTACQGQRDKTSPAKKGAKRKALLRKQFVLSGTWPRQGGGEQLAVGKEAVRAIIEKYGGNITSGYSCLTNALVIGDNPGPKKVLDTHQHGIIIIDLPHLNDVIHRRVSELSNFCNTAYPVAAMSILDRNNIQVEHPLQEPSTLPEQAQGGLAADLSIQSQIDGDGVGHRNE